MSRRIVVLAVAVLSAAGVPVATLTTVAAPAAQEQPRPAKPSTLFRDDRPRNQEESAPDPANTPPRAAPPRVIIRAPSQAPRVVPPPTPAPAPERPAVPHPLPSPAAEAQALNLLRELFAEEYTKAESSPAAAETLAAEMLRQAGELRARGAPDDIASRYVLLRESSALAARARDYGSALAAADELGTSYEVDRVALKLDLLTAASKEPGDAASAGVLVGAYFDLVEVAVAHGDLPGAAAILSQAESLGRKSKSVPLATEIQKRRKDLRDLQAQYRTLPESLAKLREKPDDQVANLTAGRFYCFVAGDWDTGLPMLAKSADQSMRTLAARDLQPPPTAGTRADLADAWWAMAEQSTGRVQDNLRKRAAHWYVQALPDLAGLKRTLAEKRIASVQSDSGLGAGGATMAAAGNTEPAARFLKNLATKMPPELLPHSSPQWNPNDANNWLRKAVDPGARVAGAAVEFTTTSALQRDPSTGNAFAFLRFRGAESVEHNGVKFQLEYSSRVTDEKSLDQLVRLVQGDKGILAGTVTQCRLGGWHRDMQNENNKLISVNITLDLKDLTFKPAPAAPAGAPNRGNQGVRVIE